MLARVWRKMHLVAAGTNDDWLRTPTLGTRHDDGSDAVCTGELQGMHLGGWSRADFGDFQGRFSIEIFFRAGDRRISTSSIFGSATAAIIRVLCTHHIHGEDCFTLSTPGTWPILIQASSFLVAVIATHTKNETNLATLVRVFATSYVAGNKRACCCIITAPQVRGAVFSGWVHSRQYILFS